jgi:hypothetical protein
VGAFGGTITIDGVTGAGAVAGNWTTGPGVPATGTFNATRQ